MGSNTGLLLDKIPITFYQSTLFLSVSYGEVRYQQSPFVRELCSAIYFEVYIQCYVAVMIRCYLCGFVFLYMLVTMCRYLYAHD
jgi:hypothetical protein